MTTAQKIQPSTNVKTRPSLVGVSQHDCGCEPTVSCGWYIQHIAHKPYENPVEEEQTKVTQFDSYLWITASLNNHQTARNWQEHLPQSILFAFSTTNAYLNNHFLVQ